MFENTSTFQLTKFEVLLKQIITVTLNCFCTLKFDHNNYVNFDDIVIA